MRTLMSVVATPFAFILIACLIVLPGAAVQAQNVIAGPIVNPNNNHIYYLLEPATWTAAEAKAVTLGGHLATVRNLTENNWIYTQFSAFSHAGSTARGLWIGLSDATTEGTYKWSSNEISTYTNWGAGEPVNQDGTDDYVHLFYPGDPRQSQWNDAPNITNIGSFPLNGVVEVLPAADLSVTKSCATNSAQSVLCTVTVTNIGTVASVSPMSITDTITSSTSNNANLTGAGGTLPASCSPGAQLITNIPLTCPTINTSLAAGASGTLLVSYTMPQGGTFTNCVSATQAQNASVPGDPNAANNTNICTTFTVTAPPPTTGSITIVKDASPNDAQDFTFTSNQASIAPFPLDDDSNSTLSNQRTFSPLPASTYTFTETQVSGWTLSNLVCTGGTATTNLTTATASITLTAGANVICTFTNTKQTTGTLTIVKDALTNDAQDFAFYAFGSTSGSINPFQLDDDAGATGANATLSNSKTFSTLAAGTYSVKEDFFNPVTVTGWTLNSLACVKASGATVGTIDMSINAFTVNLAAGDDVTCTFTNKKAPATGSITIVKDANPNDGQDFTFSSNQASIAPFPLDDDSNNTLSNQRTFAALPAGSYSFSETQVSGWALTGLVCTGGTTTTSLANGTASITLAGGDNVTCTFTNTRRATGTLTIIKDAQQDDPQDFRFNVSGSGLTAFDLDDDAGLANPLSNSITFTNLAAGIPLTVTEDAVAGWTVPSIQCLVAVPGLTTTFTDQANRTFTVNLEAGANVTCTFINVKTTGSITIVKDTQPNDPQDFTFTSNQASIPSFLLDDDNNATLSNQQTFAPLPAGTYTFTEAATTGWTLSGLVCSGGRATTSLATATATITLTAGSNVTCTFANSRSTVATAKVCGVKFNDLDGDGVQDAGDLGLPNWQISVGVATIPPVVTGNKGEYCFDTLPAGAYTIAEIPQAPWVQTFPAAPGTHSVNLQAGQVLNGINFGNTIPAGNCNPLTGSSYSLLHNGNFELAPTVAANSFSFIDDSLITGWETSASNSLIEIWGTNYEGVPAYSGGQFMELNATAGATVYQDFSVTPGSTVTITFAHRGRRGFGNQMSVAIGALGNLPITVGTYTATVGAWTLNTLTWTAPLNGGTAYQIGFVPGDNAAGGNFIDAISMVDESCDDLLVDEAVILTDLHVFNFFEDKYPLTFTGTFSAGVSGKYKFRFYKNTGNYLALDDTGAVYLLGPVSDNQIKPLGSAAEFRASIVAWNAGPVPTERVFAFAEANLAGLFKGPATAGTFEQYTYRLYAATGNTLAVDNAGNIFLRGPSTGNALMSVGTVESFRAAINNWYGTLKP